MDTCSICIDKYNKSTRKIVTCPKCQNSACAECHQRYILSSINDAHCMSCKHPWDRTFLVNNFTYKFVDKEYKDFVKNLLFDREKANMQEAYEVLDNYKKGYDMDNDIKKIEKELLEKTKEFENLRDAISVMKNEKYKLVNRQDAFYRGEDPDKNFYTSKEEKFFGNCPNQGCRGIITSRIRCNVCDQRVCKSCKEPIGNEENDLKLHSCNPQTLESLKQIKKDSKQCPKCRTYIFKIHGCNQMWCTNCNISFCWRTGEIYKGKVIHNPHYFDWLNRHNTIRETNVNDICGNENLINELRSLNRSINSILYSNSNIRNDNDKAMRVTLEVTIDYAMRVLPNLRENSTLNRNLIIKEKVDFLLNKIDENDLKKVLQAEELKVQKNIEKANIIETFVNGMCGILFKYYNQGVYRESVDKKELDKEIKNFFIFCNECSLDFVKRYKTTCYIFNYGIVFSNLSKKVLFSNSDYVIINKTLNMKDFRITNELLKGDEQILLTK